MLFRAGNTSCATTSIAIAAASEGVELTALEVRVGSRSDARGLVGMSHANGTPIYAGLFDVELDVVVAANGSTPASLISLVEGCLGQSPVGYQTDTAFSRAFSREYGLPPAKWRRSQT